MRARKNNEEGFSFVDVVIAVMILMIGILALVGALAGAIVRSQESAQEIRGKQYAEAALESVISARDISVQNTALGAANQYWNNIRNVANGGVFLDGPQAVRSGEGNDGVLGTADDNGAVVPGYSRTILIEDVPNPDLPTQPINIRRITVTVSYTVGRASRSVKLQTYLGNY